MGEILKRAGVTSVRKAFPDYAFGWIEESKVWKGIEPYGRKGWKIKSHRPFMVVGSDKEYVYFILFTSSSFRFPCDRDKEYGIEDATPEVDLSRCEPRDFERCRELGKCKVFKRMLGSSCRIVLRIRRRLLEEGSYTCGVCSEELLPEELRRIVSKELEEWKHTDSGNS